MIYGFRIRIKNKNYESGIGNMEREDLAGVRRQSAGVDVGY